MKKYSKQDQEILGHWAIAIARRVLPLFESALPGDKRPRNALAVAQKWVRTQPSRMDEIRAAALAAHAAARRSKKCPPASFAARACGHAVATAHVAQHAFGASLYALKAIAAAAPEQAYDCIKLEHARQARLLPPSLRREFLKRFFLNNGARPIHFDFQRP